jgi:hypothetical protein
MMTDYQIEVFFNVSIHNAKPWCVGLRHRPSGAIDETYSFHKQPIDAIWSALAKGQTLSLPVHIPDDLRRQYALTFADVFVAGPVVSEGA